MRSCDPNVKRCALYVESTPMVAIQRPMSRLMNALTNDFPASAAIDVKPKKTAAKYSGGPNFRAISLNGTAKATITVDEISPPVNAATSAQPSALAARPDCVML